MGNDPKQPQKTIMGWSPLQQPPAAPQAPQPPQAPPYGAPVANPNAFPGPSSNPYPSPNPYPIPSLHPNPYANPSPGPNPYPPAAGPQPMPAYGQPQSMPPAQPYGAPPSQPPYGAPPSQPPYGAPQPMAAFGGMPQPMPGYGGAPQPMPGYGGPPPGYAPQHGQGRPIPGADATTGVSARVRFIRLTYLHLFGAILAFAGLEWLLFNNEMLATKVSAPLTEFALGGRANWGAVLAVFMVVSIGTHYLAEHTRAKPLHYIGLVLYVIAEALIFVPLLAIVAAKSAVIVAKGGGEPNIIRDAAYITLGVFGALTLSVFVTKKDFSFLRTALVIAGAASMGLIVLSLVFGFNLGIVFSVAMVLLAAGQILYETSQVMAHDDPESYVGASLALFASVALLFWYVIRILMKLRE
jgi:hypothetical protein